MKHPLFYGLGAFIWTVAVFAAGVQQPFVANAGSLSQLVFIADAPGTDTACLGSGGGSNAALGYSTISSPSPYGAPSDYTFPDGVIAATTMADCTDPGIGNTAILRISGFGADPGQSYFRGVYCDKSNGTFLGFIPPTAGVVAYSFSSGSALWQFTSATFNFSAGTGASRCLLLHG